MVVVCGASSGIGRATALACARVGDDVVLVARSEPALQAVAGACAELGARALVVVADVTDEASLHRVVERTVARFGRLDAWVHTAALMAYGRVEDVPGDVFEHVVRTNLVGTANVARVVLPHLRAQAGGGTLVLIGSLLDKTTTPLMGAYVSSKWGARGLARVLRIETRDAPHVHVASVSPAGVDTPIYHLAANYVGREGRPPPPVDTPEKVARAVLRSLDRPRRERVVGPASRLVQLGHVAMPPVYDALVGPLVQLAALSRTPREPGSGNVFGSGSEGHATHGRWGRHWLRPVAVTAVATGAVLAAGAAATTTGPSRRS